jgi:hypothetical protein
LRRTASQGVRCYHRPMPAARRFPPPWMIEEHNNACFIVKDATGEALACVYFKDGRELLTRDEARRIAANIAKLQEPLANGKVLVRRGRRSALTQAASS